MKQDEKMNMKTIERIREFLRALSYRPEKEMYILVPDRKWIVRAAGPGEIECKCPACGYKDYIPFPAVISPTQVYSYMRSDYWLSRKFCPICGEDVRTHSESELKPDDSNSKAINLTEEYAKAVRNWLVNYQVKTAELQGRYTPYEVLGWVVSDWRKENDIW